MDRISPIVHNTRHMDDLNRQLKRLVDSGLNARYIAEHLNIEVGRVERAMLGEYDPPLPRKPKRTWKIEPKPLIEQAMKLVPVTRAFPVLDELTDSERIITLTKHGISAEKIRRYLDAQLTADQIGAYVRSVLGPAPKGNSSREHSITSSFMPYVHEALARLGKDRYQCELCLDPVEEGCVVHHTKYEGATVYDLMYICQSCNTARENKGLA